MKLRNLLLASALIFLFALPFTTATPYSGLAYNTMRPSVYGQYNTRYNSVYGGAGYVQANAWGKGAQPWYYSASAYRPVMSTRCSNLFGCDSVQTGHMYIGSVVDYAYYSNPDLFAVRYMNNHQRYIRGIRPQNFIW